MAIVIGTECYCVCCEGLGWANREELILNISMFVVSVWEVQYRRELILNVTLFVVMIWGAHYREELILNVNVICCDGLGRAI